jgi:hypothetical protein
MLLLAIFPEGKKAIVASQQLATSAFLRRRNGPDVPKNQKPRGVLAKIPSGKMAIV